MGVEEEEMNIEEFVAPSLSSEQKQQLQQMMEAFPVVFQTMCVLLNMESMWVILVKKELDEMMPAEVVRPSTTLWASLIILVEKKDSGVYFCVDYRRLTRWLSLMLIPCPR